MRLVKINDIILNMDNIAVIKGKEANNNKVNVYAYTADQEIWLGICDSREDYQQWVDAVYTEFGEHFLGEIIAINDDEEELWK
jgi:hypothetical protein